MLRFIHIILDGLGSLMALLSPVCIIHWLLETTGVKAAEPLTKPLDPFFSPLNQMFGPLFEACLNGLNHILFTPLLGFLNTVLRPLFTLLASFSHNTVNITGLPTEIPYLFHTGGHTIPITQGLLGLCFTLVFFACSTLSQMVKVTESQVEVATKDLQQRRRLSQLQTEQKKQQKRVTANQTLLLCIHCNFQQNPTSTSHFESLYPRYSGRAVEFTPDSMILEFDSLENTLRFCIESAQHVLKYYASLRPIDPQPPFRIGIHAYPIGAQRDHALKWSRQLIRYAGDNQMIFSPLIKEMMEAFGQLQQFKFQPQGYYQFEDGNQEIYRLNIR